jgi:hypothetical protein
MKNLFNDISNDERQRILEMHQNATKRNYLTEQGTQEPTGQTPPKTIASFGPENQELYKKFTTLNVDGDGQDFKVLYSLFDPEGKWMSNQNITAPFSVIIMQSLAFYASKRKTPNEVGFSDVIVSNVVPKAKEAFYLDGKPTNETNYQRLFGKSTNPVSPIVNVSTTAKGGINTAFKQFFDWKLQNS